MYKLVRKSTYCSSNQLDKLDRDVEYINDYLKDGWEVKHIESFLVRDEIFITQLLLYKKDGNVLTNTKTENKPAGIDIGI